MNNLFISQQTVHVVTTGLQQLNKQGVTAWNGFILLGIGTTRGGKLIIMNTVGVPWFWGAMRDRQLMKKGLYAIQLFVTYIRRNPQA